MALVYIGKRVKFWKKNVHGDFCSIILETYVVLWKCKIVGIVDIFCNTVARYITVCIRSKLLILNYYDNTYF